MTILAKIRSRVGLIVGSIFVALLAFVLTDFLGNNTAMFGRDTSVGEINGTEISIMEFNGKVEQYSQGRSLSEMEQQQMSEGVWAEYIENLIFVPEYDELGIVVTDDELADQMMGDNISPYMMQFFQDRQTGQVNPQFANAMGGLDGAKIRQFVAGMQPEQETQWAEIEVSMRKQLRKEKYNQLVRKGIYVTTAQAKREHNEENTKYTFNFVTKKYADIPDSTIKVTDAELEDYYKSHEYKFKQREEERDMEFIGFDIFPSADDIANQRKEMESVATTFAGKSGIDDSLYVLATSDNPMFVKEYMRSGQFPVGTDSAFLKAAPGTVLGPYNMGQNVVVYKVYGNKVSADSAKVRHILVACKDCAQASPEISRTKAQAKMRADSIQRVVKSKKAKLEDIVEKLTDDPGSKSGNKGDYGWFTPESGFVQPFKDAGFNNNKGDVVVVETEFGYHVIEVLDKTAPSTKVQVAKIESKTEASEATIRAVFNTASQFAVENNTAEKFNSGAQAKSLNVQKSDKIVESSRYINGLENSREIVRWLYNEDREIGQVSEPFQSGERYVVCKLTKIVKKGVKPLAEVRDICELEVRKQKKAQMIIDELNKNKGANLEAWATNMKTTVMPAANITLGAPYIAGAGYEGEVVGKVSAMAVNQMSAPIKGSMGVYVVIVTTVSKAEPLTDVKAQQARLIQGYGARTDNAVNDVLRENADIVDNRAKHY
jgi:peptidyl-prolyl cis-trans isomerase D